MTFPADPLAAAQRLQPWAHRTPVLTSSTLDTLSGAHLFFKCENLQRVGAFKFRGAMNAVLQLSDSDRASGVITHSSGNHAQALALAGQLANVPVCVVMPHTAPAVKRAATQGYGARVVPCEPTLADREATVERFQSQHGYTLIHPFDNWHVIEGQSTAALELLDQSGPLDLILTPCGGGGLLAGTALAVQALHAPSAVLGAEPSQADDARRSLEAGHLIPSLDPTTIADGLRTSLGAKPFSVIRQHVERILCASEPQILDAMRLIYERLKIIIEPSAAVPVAALLNSSLNLQNRRIGIILSGGNLDLSPLFDTLAARWLQPPQSP